MTKAIVEVLTFSGCPNGPRAVELAQQVIAETAADAELRVVLVESDSDAQRHRFLGSPSIRVDGVDVEPRADERDAFVLSCRIYRTDHGMGGLPDACWLREALSRRP